MHIAARGLDQYRDPESLRFLSHGELLQAATLPFLTLAKPLAKCGLAVIPCPGDDGKSPKGAVSFGRWRKPPGEAFLTKLTAKHPAANIAVLTNLSHLTVVDIDGNDRKLVAEIQRNIGPTPLIVHTPSGGSHLYYRSSGERNTNLRRFGLPIDVKGRAPGYVVCPPSIHPSSGKPYYFGRGSWTDLADLPTCELQAFIARLTPRKATATEPEPPPDLIVGQRNNSLFKAGLRFARNCDDEPALLGVLTSMNDTAANPLPQAEIENISRNAWHYQSTGKNWVGAEAHAVLTAGDLRALMSASNWADAWALYSMLRMMHGGRSRRGEPFAISASAMAKAGTMGNWNAKRIWRARDTLVASGLVQRIHEGGRGKHDPSLYILVDAS
jgi:hypothetical protein